MTLKELAFGGISLDAAGLVALADLTSIAERTALRGNASWLDTLFLAPGIHRHQQASEVNKGELPKCGAMNTGYVFRIENPATVYFLQTVGKTGHMTTVEVDTFDEEAEYALTGQERILKDLRDFFSPKNLIASILFLFGIGATIAAITLAAVAGDWWAFGVLGMLVLARVINIIVIKRRADSRQAWKGAKEESDKVSDLLVLLSQDRWVRVKGLVNDVKAVTAGQWLRDEEDAESFCTSFATLLVFVSAVLVPNTSTFGALLIILLSLVSAGLLGLVNYFTKELTMYGRSLKVSKTEPPKKYERRLEMVLQLVEEHGRDDWAVAMDLCKPKPPSELIDLHDSPTSSTSHKSRSPSQIGRAHV